MNQSEERTSPSRAERTRSAIRNLLQRGAPLTADELAARLDLPILYVRPRVSEMVTASRLVDSGRRGRNASGKRAIRWTVPVR